MSEHRDPLLDLREQFRQAAAREIEDEQSRRSFRRLRSIRMLAVLLGLGVTGAGVATAVELISIGEDRPDVEARPDRYKAPAEGGPVVAITADDPEQELPWAVATYTSPVGEQCALLGQALGPELGVVEDGRFRRYEPGTGGACGDIENIRLFSEVRPMAGRTLLYGRARDDIAALRARFDGQAREVEPGPGGAFLFVFDEPPRRLELIPLASDGREAPLRKP